MQSARLKLQTNGESHKPKDTLLHFLTCLFSPCSYLSMPLIWFFLLLPSMWLQVYFSPESKSVKIIWFAIYLSAVRFFICTLNPYVGLLPVLTWLQDIFRKFGPVDCLWPFALYNRDRSVFCQRLVWIICVGLHIGCRTGSGMWRSLWCCMSKVIWDKVDLNGWSSGSSSRVPSSSSQLIWGGRFWWILIVAADRAFGVCFVLLQRVVVLPRCIQVWRFGLTFSDDDEPGICDLHLDNNKF